MQCSNLWILCTHWRLSCLCWSSRNVIIYLLVCVYTVGDVCMCSSGPGQYDLSVKSFPPTALISSREDRFRVSMNTNPGPSAYQVNMLLQLHVTLLKHYFPAHSHSTSLLDQPTFSHSALTSVYVWTRLLSEFTSYISTWPIVSVCSDATDILYVSEYLKSIRFLCDLELKRKKLFALLNYSYF